MSKCDSLVQSTPKALVALVKVFVLYIYIYLSLSLCVSFSPAFALAPSSCTTLPDSVGEQVRGGGLFGKGQGALQQASAARVPCWLLGLNVLGRYS